MNAGWFEAEDELDEIQAAFVQALRAEADTWPLDPANACLVLPHYAAYGGARGESAHGRLLAWVDIPDADGKVILLTVGAYLDRDRVVGDELHNQLLTLPATPTPIGFEEHGTPQFLAIRTSQWLGSLSRRPIVCQEWLRSGEVYARRWIFAASGRALSRGTRSRIVATKPSLADAGGVRA